MRFRIEHVFVISALFTIVIGLYSLFDPFGRDQGIHATIGDALNYDLLTYHDVYNIKPPMTTLVHWLALALFGHSVASIRIFDLIAVTLTVLMLVRLVDVLRKGHLTALFTAIAYASFYFSLDYWHRAQTDGWAAFVVTASVLCLVLGWQRPTGRTRAGYLFTGGVLISAAFAFKYTVAGVSLVLIAPLLAGGMPRFYWRDIAWYTLGALMALFVIFGTMAWLGILNDFLEIQNYIRSYVSHHTDLLTTFTLGLVRLLSLAPLLSALAAGGVLLLVTDARRKETRLYAVVTLIWLLTSALSPAVQGKGFFYHYHPMLMPIALLAGGAITELFQRLRQVSPRIGLTAAAVLAAGLVIGGQTNLAVKRGLFDLKLMLHGASLRDHWAARATPSDYDFVATIDASAKLDTLRKPSDTVFVWGYETLFYFLQNTPPRYRYPYSFPLVASFHDGRYTADLMVRLESTPPTFFVVQSQDATPHVTGTNLDSREMLPQFPELDLFLHDHYRQIASQPRFDIWKHVE